MNPSSEQLWYLASLKLAGEAGPDDLAELDRLLKENPEAVFQLELIEKMWRQRKDLPEQKIAEAYSKHLQRLSNHLSEPALQYADGAEETVVVAEKSRRKTGWWVSGVAASVLVGMLLFFLPDKKQKGAKLLQNVVSTRLGSKSKVQLPDGTVVVLNAGSRLTYDQAFNGTLREVHLTGEAFFDVAKDKARPFIIHTNTVDVKVLGTVFNLRAYPDEQTTETSLIHGSVEVVLLDNPDKKIVLKPSEKLVVQNTPPIATAPHRQAPAVKAPPLVIISKVHSLQNDSSILETSWVDNKLAFDDESLEVIAQKLERWYDVEILITDETLKKATYTVTFEGEGLEEVMAALKMAGGFSYSINKKEVRITP